MKFLLVGPFEVRDGETPLPLPRTKHRALLALLVLRAGEVVSTDTLVEELWGEGPPLLDSPNHRREGGEMKKALQIGGIAAGLILVGFGIAALVLGIRGGDTVRTNLKQEFITGTPDMSPSGIEPEVKAIQGEQQKIAAEQKKANVPPSQQYTFTTVEAPSCSVAGEQVDDGNSALCFGKYMRIHALSSSRGLTYSQMGRYAAKPDAPPQSTDFNGGTNDPKYAQTDPESGQPVSNGARNLWVTETSLSTALYLAYTASAISLFGIVVGVALLLSGIGFLILALSGAIEHVPFRRSTRSEPAPQSN
jgi:hypothetical protein